MSVLTAIKHNWTLFRFLGLGFCSLSITADDPHRHHSHPAHKPQHLLTFGWVDLGICLLLNTVYIAGTWAYIIRVFYYPPEQLEELTTEAYEGANTVLAVSYISFATEQLANTVLIALCIGKQSNFVRICNKLHEIDGHRLEAQLKLARINDNISSSTSTSDLPIDAVAIWDKKQLRRLYWIGGGCLAYFCIQFALYALVVGTWDAFFQVIAIIRPVVSDFVNLQCLSIVLLINNRLRWMVERNRVNGHLDIPTRFLFDIGNCISEANTEFSLMFLIQSVRLIITADNNIYQVIMLFKTYLYHDGTFLVIIVLVELTGFSAIVYGLLCYICHRTQLLYQELVNCVRVGSMLEGDQMLPRINFGDTPLSPSVPGGRLEIDRARATTKTCLHFLHQRNQRRGRGFGFDAVGVLDIDLGGVFAVSQCK